MATPMPIPALAPPLRPDEDDDVVDDDDGEDVAELAGEDAVGVAAEVEVEELALLVEVADAVLPIVLEALAAALRTLGAGADQVSFVGF